MREQMLRAGNVQTGVYETSANPTTPPRPTGALQSQVAHLNALVDQLEGQRNMLWSSMERLLAPRPEPASDGAKTPELISGNSLEGQLTSLCNRTHRLLQSMPQLADTLDSAV